MSTRTIGYVDGKPIKADEGPSYARAGGYNGSLVVGVSDSDRDRHSKRKFAAKKREEEAA